jgi:hypothetical protein
LTFVRSNLREEASGDAIAQGATAYMERLRSQARIVYN